MTFTEKSGKQAESSFDLWRQASLALQPIGFSVCRKRVKLIWQVSKKLDLPRVWIQTSQTLGVRHHRLSGLSSSTVCFWHSERRSELSWGLGSLREPPPRWLVSDRLGSCLLFPELQVQLQMEPVHVPLEEHLYRHLCQGSVLQLCFS